MRNPFFKIVLTSPDNIGHEIEKCCRLLESDAIDVLHFRKPSWSKVQSLEWLKSVPEEFLGKLTLHDHFNIARELPVGGLHLNSRNSTIPDGFSGRLSRSCHSIEELEASDGYDYVTLSPIFDSISKSGYSRQKFSDSEIKRLSSDRKIIALGGVDPSRKQWLLERGFAGIAILGYLWHNPEGKSFDEIVDTIKLF